MAKHAAPRVHIRWWIPVLVIAVAASLIALILVNDTGEDSAPTAGSPLEPNPVVTEVEDPEQADVDKDAAAKDDDPLADGPTDAPVTLVVFSDYQCPFCAAWSKDTLPTMLEYVDDGNLRIEWREVNVFGSASVQAALQDRHWEYHAELFAGGEPRSPGELTPEALTEAADTVGLDVDRFTDDMNAKSTAEAVEENAAMGTDLGAFSTPTFLLNGQPYVGAQPTDVFVDAIEEAKGSN
ncbi:thioredoxin domain-containing protein [Brevibacterium sp. K11IcPPYGO002]|uniref:DsbA family protein n=1 Tax=Brevibacterium sp. K11IcPPYGO002 TaxID=3058837 RepID=UPI003D818EE1